TPSGENQKLFDRVAAALHASRAHTSPNSGRATCHWTTASPRQRRNSTRTLSVAATLELASASSETARMCVSTLPSIITIPLLVLPRTALETAGRGFAAGMKRSIALTRRGPILHRRIGFHRQSTGAVRSWLGRAIMDFHRMRLGRPGTRV